MSIFVLGGGYVGTTLLKQWSLPNDTFWVSTTTPDKLPSLEPFAERAFLLDSKDSKKLASVLEECDGIVVCVAPGAGKSYEATYLNTAKSVQKALQGRKKPFFLLYTSSTSVYGDHQGVEIDETAERRTTSENGKILCETEDTYLACQTQNVRVCILRLAGIFGPGREREERARHMSGREMPGNGNSPTNHVHLDDCVRGIEFCFKRQLGSIYNLANNDHRSRRDLYDAICHELGIPTPHWDASKPSEHGSNCIVSSKKIFNAGFEFTF